MNSHEPASESAEELAERIAYACTGWMRSKENRKESCRKAAGIITDHDAKVKREAADRFVAKLKECIDILPNKVEGVITGSDIERLISAILGEGEA